MNKLISTTFLIGVLLMVSCTSDKTEEIYEPSQLIEVGLNVGGEFSLSKSPLKQSQTQHPDLFAIQIFDVENDKPYAYLVGDSIEKVKIKFPLDTEFQVKMTYLKNAENLVRKVFDNVWGDPFVADYMVTELNKVYYTSATKLRGISSSFIDTEDHDSPLQMGRYVELDRYHGVVNSFTATEDSTALNIDLKRMVFGVTLNIELQDLEPQQIQFTINSSYLQQVYMIPISEGKGNLEIPFLSLGFPNIYGDELDYGVDDLYEENVHISIGTPENEIKYYDGKILVPRNVRMKINFKSTADVDGTTSLFDLQLQQEEMEEEVIQLPTDN